MIPQQLTLGISLGSDFDFDHFVAGPNTVVVETIRQAIEQPQFVYVWGDSGSGRTHLLHAACRHAATAGHRTAMLPLSEASRWTPAVIEGWETLALVAVDDIQRVAGQAEWEHALFLLYNELRDAGASLLIAGDRPPAALDIRLQDLKSRLGAMLVYQIHTLDDEQRLAVLLQKAKARGLDLPEETARYLLVRVSRNMHDLAALLERLDNASLAHQRRLTIPFVREQIDKPG